MKGQISRLSHRRARRYSGLFHIQGGMITDADLNEAATIARDRVEALGHDTIRDGVPAVGGVIGNANAADPKAPFRPYLRAGLVYADGVRGEVGATGGKDLSPGDGLTLLEVQEDLPGVYSGKPTGEQILYADIWHRTVHPLEDPRLIEVALHGADTAFRTRTMAQLKLAPIGAADSLANGAGSFPRIGTGRLTVSPLANLETGNDCDPCAAEIPLEGRVPNALFRIEVVAMTGTAHKPESVTLAWSAENAAEIAPVTALPDGFVAAGHAYEHSTVEIERMKGVFADPSLQKTSEFAASVLTNDAARFVRRWDGVCTFDLGAGAGATLGSGEGKLDANGQPRITAGFFSASLDFRNRHVMVGDYWLVELRTNAATDGGTDARFHVVSETPLGIEHHYALLLRLKDGEPLSLTDREVRALSFPTLADVPASHVGFANACPDKFGDAANVQQALDAVCGLDAGKIGFDNTCPELYGTADTLQEALANLCGYDFGKNADRSWMATVFDWGVVCGLKIRRIDEKTVEVTPGAYLDWQGNYVTADWQAARRFVIDEIRFDPAAMGSTLRAIGIERNEGKIGLVVAPRAAFILPGERTFSQALAACEASGKGGIFDKVFDGLGDEARKVYGSILALSVSGAVKGSAVRLSGADYQMARTTVAALEEAYVGDADPEQSAQLRALIIEAERAWPVDGLVGLALEERRGRQVAEINGILIDASQDLVDACKCRAIWPDCLDRKKSPAMVPLAAVEIDYLDNGTLRAIDHVCMVGYRRQALTPHTMAYYLRDVVENRIAVQMLGDAPKLLGLDDIEGLCCPRPESKGGGFKPGMGDFASGGVLTEKPGRWRLDVARKTPGAALDMLTGNGITVVETLDLKQPETRDRLAGIVGRDGLDTRILSRERIGPGDKVALLVAEGEAAGYLVVERGSGKYPFTPASEKLVVPPRPPVPLPPVAGGATGAGEGIAALVGELDEIDRRIAALAAPGGRLGQLQDSYAGLDSAITARLSEARAAAEGIAADLPGRIAADAEAAEALRKDIDTSRTLVEDLTARHDALGEKLRTELDEMLEAGLGEQEEAMGALLGRLAARMSDMDGTQAALDRRLTRAAETLEALEPQAKALVDRVEAAAGRLAAADLSETEARLAKAAESAEALERTSAEATGRIDTLADRTQQIGRQMPGLQEAAAALESDIAARDAALRRLLEVRRTADAAHEAALSTLEGKAARLSGILEETSAAGEERIAMLEGRRRSLASALDASDRSLAALETRRAERMEAAQADLQGLVRDLAARQTQATAARQAFDTAAQEAEERVTRARSATARLVTDLDRQVTAREARVTALGSTIEGLTRTEAAVTERVDTARKELTALTREQAAIVSALRAERPTLALPEVRQNGLSEPLARFGITSVGEIAALDRAGLREVTAKDRELGRFLDQSLIKIAQTYLGG